MPAGKRRSRRAEHVADTRRALLRAARELFAERGFAATGTEDIVTAADVTRGALYHHFKDKADLFRAVMAECAQEMAQRLVEQETARAEQHPGDAWQLLRSGFQSFLDACNDAQFQRIVLIEGPAVLGHSAWDALVEEHGYILLAEALTEAVREGNVDDLPVAPLTRMLAALISEASLYIAGAEDHVKAREEAGLVLERLLAGLGRGAIVAPGVSPAT
ncbi:TetR family transcriptional regulator [Streptomyces sp. AcH 505]|uniref:TetR/AcrR family transcriptional regulator n=1 Tax=unclassified Streptomyces TaxID=2593676 RepID=UPI0005919B21|nr:TetR/AcrR family transcriptional regulator [Streptomyces sp. NBC_00370]KIF71500.1 TetR family transcriptional regulator [Streptomyces sp. AcH 505]